MKKSLENKIISKDLESFLRDYMGFRHFVRHEYCFMLDSELIKPLLNNLNETIDKMNNEINVFIKN